MTKRSVEELSSKVKFEFSVGSDPEFDDLVADIGFEDHLVALLTQEDGFDNLRIRIFPPNNGSFWEFPFSDFEKILNKAKDRLQELLKEDS